MDIQALYRVIHRLKQQQRIGWKMEGVKNGESVAEHSYSTALLTLLLGPQANIQVDKAVAMALLHDVSESSTGDLLRDWMVEFYRSRGKEIPQDQPGVTDEEKYRREKEALVDILAIASREDLLSLWEEFEAGKTPEARFVRDMDKLDRLLQAEEYNREQGVGINWAADERNHPTLPIVRRWFEHIFKKK